MIQINKLNKGANMNLNTQKVIYKMLTENTGIHMCDSGGEDGRMWQRNQKKSFNDFNNEPEIIKDDDLIYKSLFHHLSNSVEYLPDLTNQLNKWIKKDKYDAFKNPDGRSNSWNDVEDFMLEYVYPDQDKVNCTYTYNFDNCLSQDIQFLSCGDIYENNIIALSIHNGADARGGLTDYKFFKIDPDMFYMMDSEYYQDSEVA
jgi:hypothetical protein